jgi:hypothetical protein
MLELGITAYQNFIHRPALGWKGYSGGSWKVKQHKRNNTPKAGGKPEKAYKQLV